MTDSRSLCLCTILLVLTAACAAPVEEAPFPVAMLSPGASVTVTGGEIQGAASDTNPDVIAFKGVPFSAPPVGDLRWRPPEPIVAWDGVRDATRTRSDLHAARTPGAERGLSIP